MRRGPGWRRRDHPCLRARLRRVGSRHAPLPRRRGGAPRRDARLRHPDRRSRPPRRGGSGRARVRRRGRRAHGRRDRRRVARAGRARGRLLRAGERRRPRGAAESRGSRDGGRRRHRPRAQGSGRGRPHRRSDRGGRRRSRRDRRGPRVTLLVRARAPATTANIGPGFDCAGAALELWNELEVSDGGEPDPEHLAVRAFALLADPRGLAFELTVRIPRARGLGSSASVIALGLVAAAAVAGEAFDSERLLALGVPLEGHADNLAAALAGGVCLTWDGRVARVAETLPLAPVAVVPASEVLTSASRESLPQQVSHEAAAFTAAHAALLGAAIASQDPDLFAAALKDELHEPFRAAQAPVLHEVRAAPPAGAAGAALSGSGPTVIVWARPDGVDACAHELRARYPDADVLPLRVSPSGAGLL